MFKLTYKSINDMHFTAALGKLCNTPGLPIKSAYNAGKIFGQITKETDELRKQFMKILEQYGEKDEKGEFKRAENQHEWAIAPDKRPAFEKDIESLFSIEFTLHYHKIAMSDLDGKNFTPRELVALEPVLHHMEVLEDSPISGGAA